MKVPSEYGGNDRKQTSSNHEENKRKTTIREMNPSKRNKMEVEADDLNVEMSDCERRREEIKKIKAKDRTESEKREFTQLKARIFRHQKYIDEEN